MLRELHCPKDFVFCILLLYWSYAMCEEFEQYEFFAGVGNITKVAKASGYRALRFDLIDNQQPASRKSNFMDLSSASGYALAMLCLLRAKLKDFVAHFGLKCSSLCQMNCGTSMRAPCCSLGFDKYPGVFLSNVLSDRMCALLLLTTCLGGAWTVEQPLGSVLEFYTTFRRVVKSIYDAAGPFAVVKVKWWMIHYSAKTPKRHYGYSNSAVALEFDKGKLTQSDRKPKSERIRTADAYYDKKGVKRYKGNSNLRSTEIYPMPFARAFVDKLERLKQSAQGMPQLPEVVPSAVECLQNWGPDHGHSDVWQYADFASVFNYLRGSRKLKILRHVEKTFANDDLEKELLQQLQDIDEKLDRESDVGKDVADMDTLPATEDELCKAGKPMEKGCDASTELPTTLVVGTPVPETPPQVNGTETPKAASTDAGQSPKAYIPKGMTLRQFNLRRAAKARIHRMIQPKSKRRELLAPDYVAKEWQNGDKNGMADLLVSVNWSKESFFSELLIIIKRKKTYQLVIDEGWYSESELKELGWSQKKINGAKERCLALGESHARRNSYDGELEFWVVTKETGKRTEESSYEEEHKKRQKVDDIPESDLGKDFAHLEARVQRDQLEKDKKAQLPQLSKYQETKDKLQRFLQSMTSKSGKLRALVRDLKKGYSTASISPCVKSLEDQILAVDTQYDLRHEAWGKGEVDKFASDEWYKKAEAAMDKATLVCSKAAAEENKIRNAKKYFDKKDTDEVDETPPPKLPKGERKERKETQKEPKSKKDKKHKSKK
ncbi:unnamed protein product [Cladocopium goreaui]|uniref:Uncharacterized protein n=1 Tax=Cladocopium goreaui TaxID=2562237 RepID=A0A9P1G1A7_9DINO|nr:unnamed protein product [Cladocopium goreaui]